MVKTKVINRKTGEVKEIQLATQKQVDYLRKLEHLNGMVVHNHTNKTVWQAAKRITKLKAKYDKNHKQQSIFSPSTKQLDERLKYLLEKE